MFENIKHIVTHPGMAHFDDFMSCCMILRLNKKAAIHRREPLNEELEDSKVCVLDCGFIYNPGYINFDHHQFPADEEPARSTLSLLADYLELESDYLPDWWDAAVYIDAKGPFQFAKKMGYKEFPKEMRSFVESVMLRMFQQSEIISKTDNNILYEMMVEVGETFFEQYENLKTEMQYLETNSVIVDINGHSVLIADCTNTNAINKYQKATGFIANAIPDARGGGWSLFRINDHPSVDFRALKEDERVSFVHANGFVAKTKEKCSNEELVDMLKKSITV